jgi:DNA replication and repair protein RecF
MCIGVQHRCVFLIPSIKIKKEGYIMILKELSIINFRNYKNISINLSPKINIIYGNNAQGKTNLLESIYVLGITKSHRSFIDNNLIKSGEKKSKIKGIVKIENLNTTLEVNIENKNKQLKIDNNDIKKVSDYISKMNIIIFYPEDLELIKGSPAIRRRYINLELAQLYPNYLILISEYNKLLKIRNEYLKKMQKNISVDNNYFCILTNYLIEKAVNIYIYRKKFIDQINFNATKIFKNISELDNFYIKYKPNIDFDKYEKDYLKKILDEKIKKAYQNEIKIGSTLFGPHKDDFEFYIDNFNLKNYGSQGQQRVAILSLKLSEIEIFKNERNTEPILLLDDVFSELDDIKKNNLLLHINDNIQTIITTTDLKNIDAEIIKQSKIINIDNGMIVNKEEV